MKALVAGSFVDIGHNFGDASIAEAFLIQAPAGQRDGEVSPEFAF